MIPEFHCGHPHLVGNTYVEPKSGRHRCRACHQGRAREWKQRQYEQAKASVLAHYGNSQCACCHERDTRFLTIDHPKNDGAATRRELGRKARGSNFYVYLVKQGLPPGLVVLCYNCNCGRNANGGICPHKDPQPRRRYGKT